MKGLEPSTFYMSRELEVRGRSPDLRGFLTVVSEAAVAAPRNAGTSETDLCLEARERMSVMDRERPSQFGCIQTYCTRGYPIDSGLRRAYRVERGKRRRSPIAPALTDRLLRNGRER